MFDTFWRYLYVTVVLIWAREPNFGVKYMFNILIFLFGDCKHFHQKNGRHSSSEGRPSSEGRLSLEGRPFLEGRPPLNGEPLRRKTPLRKETPQKETLSGGRLSLEARWSVNRMTHADIHCMKSSIRWILQNHPYIIGFHYSLMQSQKTF